LPFRWSAVQYAPQLAKTGSWKTQPEAVVPAANAWRQLKVVEVCEETPTARSFYLQPVDGATLPRFEPGQFLPIRLNVAGHASPLIRTYTLSDADHGRHYRITVKREGVASTWLHEHVTEGAIIEAKAPSGMFTLVRANTRPVVLLSAGIGITPMIAMLNSLLASQPGDTQPEHIYFIHGARDANDHPFAEQLMAMAATHPQVSVYLRDSRPSEAMPEDGVRSMGRVDIEFLKRVLPFGDYDFYLCGPGAFMQDIYNGLRALNIADDRIRFEAFGPASVKRAQSAVVAPAAEVAATALVAQVPVPAADPAQVSKVVFMRTRRDAMWSKETGSLLDLAEANDVPAQSNCRSGVCGTCSTRLLSGEVTYPVPIEGEVAPGHALICSAIPARTGSGEESTVVLDL